MTLTFEFTHKSFGEYLTARRMVLELKLIQQQLTQHQDNPDIGWDEKECLKRWVILCGPTVMDEYLLSFLRDEIKLQNTEQVQQWQQMLCGLISYMLHHGMPLESLGLHLSFFNETQQARNASEALLATLSSCAWVTESVSTIRQPRLETFGHWLMTLQGQRIGPENPVAFDCLNHLDLNSCLLLSRDFQESNLQNTVLQEANLQGANLQGANLQGASLQQANLQKANLQRAKLIKADLQWTDLRVTNLQGARLQQANLLRADFLKANLEEANLEEANLVRANLRGANLVRAKLHGANLKGINLAWASLQWADLTDTNLESANLQGANLQWANLQKANLQEADLQGADLVRVDLQKANLQKANLQGTSFLRAALQEADLHGANLDGITWDQETLWNGVRGLEAAKNVPTDLKQQLGLEPRNSP